VNYTAGTDRVNANLYLLLWKAKYADYLAAWQPVIEFLVPDEDAPYVTWVFGVLRTEDLSAKWLSRDTLGERIGPNLYDYVGNDPANFIDPDGRFAWLAIAAFAVAAYGIEQLIEKGALAGIAANSKWDQEMQYQDSLRQANCHYGGDLPPDVQAFFDKWKNDLNRDTAPYETIIKGVPGTSMGKSPANPPPGVP
jgi:uncharacterized protein RhaS with RHS repeats